MEIHLFLLLYNALLFCSFGTVAEIDLCPDGSYVLARGLSSEDRKYALDEHNRFRQMLVDGEVAGQPKAKYMKTMFYDQVLEDNCVPVSNQCIMNHIPVTDERWHCVGQNIFISWHSQFNIEQNWTAALESWFYECNDFAYPDVGVTGRQVGHYTQVAWANSDTIGCDFILFIDKKKPWSPFCSMYTCNYGPCGNYNGLPPYELADGQEYNKDTSESSSSESDESASREPVKTHPEPTPIVHEKPVETPVQKTFEELLNERFSDKHISPAIQDFIWGILGKKH